MKPNYDAHAENDDDFLETPATDTAPLHAAAFAAPQEVNREAATSLRAADLLKNTHSDGPILTGRRITVNEKALARPISDVLVPVEVHWLSIGSGDERNLKLLRCNGKGCTMCACGIEAKSYLLVTLYFVMDGALGVIAFSRSGGPGTLCTQLVPILARPNCTDLIIEIERRGRQRYFVRIVKEIGNDEHSYGEDVLADVEANGAIEAKDLLATIEQMSNDDLLDEYPQLRAVLAAKGKRARTEPEK